MFKLQLMCHIVGIYSSKYKNHEIKCIRKVEEGKVEPTDVMVAVYTTIPRTLIPVYGCTVQCKVRKLQCVFP